MKATSISVSMWGTCSAIEAHCTWARSAGNKAGHKFPSAVLVSSRPSARAASPEMSKVASAK